MVTPRYRPLRSLRVQSQHSPPSNIFSELHWVRRESHNGQGDQRDVEAQKGKRQVELSFLV